MKSKFLYLYFTILITLGACEFIVDVKVNQTDPYLVVDAWLTHSVGDQTIRLTTTQPYFDNTFTPGVTGAQVTITDESGQPFEFQDRGDGNYIWSSTDTFGTVGESYFLEILWEGNTYTSFTILPRQVSIDSLVFNTMDADAPDQDYYAEFFGRDPDGIGDAYWLKAWKNGQYLNKPSEIYPFDDKSFSEESGKGIPFIFPIRVLPNSIEQDINGNSLPLYRFEERFEVLNKEISDFYGSRALVDFENERLEILHDDAQRKDPLGGGVKIIPLDGSPYSLESLEVGSTTQYEVVKKADSLYLELHTISPDAYFFLARLQQETDRPSGFGALFSTPPSDLPTNIVCSDPEVPVVGFFNLSNVSSYGQRITEDVARIDD